MQLLPQVHLHAQVMVDKEAHWVVAAVKVVVRVVTVVGGHEAIGAHLHHKTKKNYSQNMKPILWFDRRLLGATLTHKPIL